MPLEVRNYGVTARTVQRYTGVSIWTEVLQSESSRVGGRSADRRNTVDMGYVLSTVVYMPLYQLILADIFCRVGGLGTVTVITRGQSVSEFLRDGLPASIQFPVMPKHAQYARFGGECSRQTGYSVLVLTYRLPAYPVYMYRSVS